MSKNFDSPLEIGFCGSMPEHGEDKLPERPVLGTTTMGFDALYEISSFVRKVDYEFLREQLLAALKENARLSSESLYARRSFHNLQRCNQFFERCENPVCRPLAPLACYSSMEQPREIPGDRAKLERISDLEATLALMKDELFTQQDIDEAYANGKKTAEATLALREEEIARLNVELSKLKEYPCPKDAKGHFFDSSGFCMNCKVYDRENDLHFARLRGEK